jgi:hypothetical protein
MPGGKKDPAGCRKTTRFNGRGTPDQRVHFFSYKARFGSQQTDGIATPQPTSIICYKATTANWCGFERDFDPLRGLQSTTLVRYSSPPVIELPWIDGFHTKPRP